jgi:hypothetical protein
MKYQFFDDIYRSIHKPFENPYDICHITPFQITYTTHFPEKFTNSLPIFDGVKIECKTAQRFTGIKKIPPKFTVFSEFNFLFKDPTKYWSCVKLVLDHSQFLPLVHHFFQ